MNKCEHEVWSVVGVAGPFKPGCVVGEPIDDGTECGPRCTCVEGGEIHCKPRCSQFLIPPDLNCSIVPSLEDPCCSVPDCQMELTDPSLFGPLEITEVTRMAHNNTSEVNISHGSNEMLEENNFANNASITMNSDFNEAPDKDSLMIEGDIHATSDDEMIVLNGTEKKQHTNKTSSEGQKPSSERPQKSFTSLNDLLIKHKQLGSLPLNTTRTTVTTSTTTTTSSNSGTTTATTKTPFPNNGMDKGDNILVEDHIGKQELDQEVPHEHNATLMVIVDSEIPEQIGTLPDEESGAPKRNEESTDDKEYFEPSNSTIYDVEYSVDETHLQNNDSGSLLINGTISILPNKVNINEVDPTKAETDFPEPSEHDKSNFFSVTSHGSDRSSISELPESDATSHATNTEDLDPQSQPTYQPEHHVNVSELLDAEYEENLHLPLENSDGLEQPEEYREYLPLNQEASYLQAGQKDEINFTEDNTEHSNQSRHSSRVEASYHVEYSDGSAHSGSPSPNIHEVVSHHSVNGEEPMHGKKSLLESSIKNNQHGQSEGILMLLQTVLGSWKWESLNCFC